MTSSRPTILTFMDYYLPGYMAGGPTRTLATIVERFADDFHFRIITHDHDLGDNTVYEGITQNEWQRVGSADVFYATQKRFWPRLVYRMLREEKYAAVYLNSIFSPALTIPLLFMRRTHMVRPVPVILAPRGELADGALAIRSPKKLAYLALSRALREYDGLIWQASSEYEANDIRRVLGSAAANAPIIVAPDLATPARPSAEVSARESKQSGTLKALYLSRVHRIKNLGAALQALTRLTDAGTISLDIYGPWSDVPYWAQCEEIIATMPPNVTVRAHGPIPPEQVPSIMAQYDVFVLPTNGENFGHVILEAMSAGCPVLISDRTAFRGLESTGAGWDLPLEKPEQWVERLRELVAMDEPTHAAMRGAARAYGARHHEDPLATEQNRALFLRAIEAGGG
ncbi:MAG: glycosyltransferase family 4 protein [Gemmatimonadota bacterium]|nr:glycosyltransferase family 4 protein [Gemmatimonadota bacterium]